ncbi:LVIVD repeat-containing protein [Nonlabens xiamenensis]|uniref:hypothetical protein n=1 Tax=Nonlabens xiamenensis TaxID=2341043 RepID=UPI000F6091F0|nr:hypothetical protein [Nonlabens xiamenensis]
MRRLLYLCFFALNSCLFYGGEDDILTEPPSIYEPISVSRAVLHAQIEMTDHQTSINTGKIYIKDDFLFVIEKDMGIHVYDNSNRNTPVPKFFIAIGGITDISIKGNLIYAHHYTDLVVIRPDFTVGNLQIVHISPDVFPQLKTPNGWSADHFEIPEDHIIIDYRIL